LITAACLAVFFVSFLLGFYWLSAVGAVAALGMALRWAWTTGLDRDWPDQPAGGELELPLHPQVDEAPGWWGMLAGLLCNGTFYITALFGYLYLWAVAPGWPPESFIDTGLALPLGTALAMMLALAAFHHALLKNRQSAGGVEAGLMVSAVLSLLAAAGLFAQIVSGLPAPSSHAYVAVTTFILGYCAVHALLAAVMATYAVLRNRAGFVSARRSLDLRLGRIWTGYTLAVTLISLALIHGLPALLGAGS